MSEVPFHYVDLRTFAYETEDEKRVERALGSLLPAEVQLDRAESAGHHGDRILVLSVRLENAEDVRSVLDRLRAAPGFDSIGDELERRITEDCELFISLDKQAAFRGSIERGDGIMFRGKIEAYPARKDRAIEAVRPLFENEG